MRKVTYYRDENLPFLELKSCIYNLHPEKKHAHDEYSIALIEKGKSILEYANEKIEISEGQVILIESDVMHYCQPLDCNNWSYQMIYIKKIWFNQLLKDGKLPHKLLVKSLCFEDINKIQGIFEKLKSNINAFEKEELLIEILEYVFSVENCFVFDTDSISNNDIVCEKAKRYIDEHFLEKISLENLSSMYGLTHYYLIKLFKQKFDTTPHAYQITCRMNYAKNEMVKGRDIIDIAYELGFYDQSHFTRTFKAYFGVTPQYYLDVVNNI